MKLLCTSEVHPSEEKVTPPRFDFCHKNCKTGALITALIIAFPCVFMQRLLRLLTGSKPYQAARWQVKRNSSIGVKIPTKIS